MSTASSGYPNRPQQLWLTIAVLRPNVTEALVVDFVLDTVLDVALVDAVVEDFVLVILVDVFVDDAVVMLLVDAVVDDVQLEVEVLDSTQHVLLPPLFCEGFRT